ncbi:glucosylglycerol-phosphate synthase [Parapedobacter sp. ISTM3]|uniref:glucosylglycerol-phosphate synthase n=1 Tax=Parapedobacter sp. ISTM3 TaxID=2800130 RepID=UPI001F2FBFD6|nr:glucosylglycerol-phosphate synthase [Parapedobacter sp. ISTM3]
MMLLATDLDGTFLGGKRVDRLQLYRLIRQNENIKLVFVTGRGVETVLPLLNHPIIPRPSYVISDVGATVVDGHTLEPVEPIQAGIEDKWPGIFTIKQAFSNIEGLRFQEVPQQRRCSFYYDDSTDLDAVNAIASAMNCYVLLSAGKYLDILPNGTSKGSTLRQLVEHIGIADNAVLVAGDTLNDLSLYQTGYKGVVVGQAEEALYEATSGNPTVYAAEAPGAGGIIEAIQHYTDFRKFYLTAGAKKKIKQSGETQLLMVYHRLPFDKEVVDGVERRVPPKSPNGIIPSLLGFFEKGRSGVWIGEDVVEKHETGLARNEYINEDRYPNLIASAIPLSKKDIDLFYRIFSKEAFWPTIFSFVDKASFNHSHWAHYVKINKLFADRIAEEADQDALVWIHEYNLWMVPGFLRQLRPDVKIGFFHHTAFPPADVFNIIPWRREIIGSLLQCDFVSFHIPRYVENFVDVLRSHAPVKVIERVNAAKQFLTYSCALGIDQMTKKVEVGNRLIRLGAQPVGINVDNIKRIYALKKTKQRIATLEKRTSGKQIVLSVERLDYVKGPLEKIQAFGELLHEHPELHGKIELINICTPPSQGMKVYDKIRQELDRAVGQINGRYSNLEWTPIRYFYRSVPFEEVVTYYAIADIAWITPLRDGLNLVAKEYVAVQGQKEDADGVLVLSEFAGASVELPYAVLTNPYDAKNLKDSLLHAIHMEKSERVLRMRRLYEIISYYDIERWGKEFIQELEYAAHSEPLR